MKNILVIGGSYFVGRVFTMLALKEGHRITLINRGRYSMKEFGPAQEFTCDRHDLDAIANLSLNKTYDAVVDFCAYEETDISGLVKHLPCTFQQYVLISTTEVCVQTPEQWDELSPRPDKEPSDPVERYVYQKMRLEKELTDCAKRNGFGYTILRPVFIYGPYNYAPRESWYIKSIVEKEPVWFPSDADAEFQMVYVKDVARAILLTLGNSKAKNQCYILSAPEIMTYGSYMELLQSVSDIPFELCPVSVQTVLEKNIPLPFPLRADDSKLFSGEKIVQELGFQYSDQKQCMRLTYNAFKNVFL